MKKHSEKLSRTALLLTTDPAAAERAKDLAAIHDFLMETVFPKDLPAPLGVHALFVNLDNLCLDAHGRRQFVATLLANPPRVPTCVYSYDFDEGSESKNVVMGPRLDNTLVCRLLASLGRAALTSGVGANGSVEPATKGVDEDELARIRWGGEGGRNSD